MSGDVTSLLGDRDRTAADLPVTTVERSDTPRLLDRLVKRIEAEEPTPATLRDGMLAAQAAESGQADEVLPIALRAADKVHERMRGSADERAVPAAALSILNSVNPREIKRFINWRCSPFAGLT